MSRICFHPFFEDKTYIHISSISKMVSKFRKKKHRQFCDFLGRFRVMIIKRWFHNLFFLQLLSHVGFHHLSFSKALRPELPLWQTGGGIQRQYKSIQKSLFKKSPKIYKNMNAACNNHIYATVIFKQISKMVMKIWEHNTTSKSRPWNGAGRVILALHQLSCRLRHSEAWKSSRRRFATPLVLWKRELYDVYSNYHQLMFWNHTKPAGHKIWNISGNIHWVHYLKTSDQFAAWGIQLYTYILTLRRRRPRTSPSREFSKAWKNSSWFLPTRHFLYHESWKLPQVIKKHTCR